MKMNPDIPNTTGYIHTDHLGGTNVVSSTTSEAIEVTDYYPFGEQRVHTTSTKFDEQRKFIGEHYDDETELSYLNARYYGGSRGQFLSQDPSFLAIGSPELSDILARANGLPDSSFRYPGIESAKDRAILQAFLLDPQLQNSYGYARNNPLRYSDPTGEIPVIPAILFAIQAYGVFDLGYSAGEVLNSNFLFDGGYSDEQRSRANFNLGFNSLTTVAGLGTANKFQQAFLTLSPAILNFLDTLRGAGTQNSSFNVNTVQGRYQAVQNYNVSTGASTGGGGSAPSNNSLWVTPSGAVVNWGGQLVAPAPSENE